MQLNLPFPLIVNKYNIKNFVLHDGNQNIFDFITSSFLISNNFYLLTGSSKSGKTYICNIWHQLQNATFLDKNCLSLTLTEFIHYTSDNISCNAKYILDDFDKSIIHEENLLYLFNYLAEKNSILIATSEKFLEDFNFQILDLQSRFNNTFNFVLKNLNDDFKKIILIKLLSDLQIVMDDIALDFILKKLSNNYESIVNFVNHLEEEIANKHIKKISMSNIKTLL